MSNNSRPIIIAVLALVVTGLALRGAHYAHDYPMWHDEAAPILNVLSKTYGELWGPRLVNATEPPLTLWINKATIAALGDEPWALRLPSLLASCAGLVLLVWWTRPLLTPVGWIALTILAAGSDRLLFHACEAKTYSFDFLVGLVLLKLVVWDAAPLVGRVNDPSRWRILRNQSLAAALLSPLVFLCYPLVFMLAGFGIVQAVVSTNAWRNGERSEVKRSLVSLAFFGILSASCAFILATITLPKIQTASVFTIWAPEFPDYEHPARIPLQLFLKILDAFRYAQAPIGQILAAFAIVGGVSLARNGYGRLAAWFAIVLGINAAAWVAGKYPIGHYRVVTYLLPAIFLFAARGIETLGAAMADYRRTRLVLAAALIAVCVGQTAFRFAVTWTRLDSATPTRFVLERRQESEPVVADLWEQQYYLRKLGPRRLADAPSIDDVSTRSFWYIGNTRDCGSEFLPEYPASGRWAISSRTQFRHFVVLRFEKVEKTPFTVVNRRD